MHKAVARRR